MACALCICMCMCELLPIHASLLLLCSFSFHSHSPFAQSTAHTLIPCRIVCRANYILCGGLGGFHFGFGFGGIVLFYFCCCFSSRFYLFVSAHKTSTFHFIDKMHATNENQQNSNRNSTANQEQVATKIRTHIVECVSSHNTSRHTWMWHDDPIISNLFFPWHCMRMNVSFFFCSH